MKYVLLFCGTDEDAAAFAALSEVKLKERYALVGRWFAEHRSRFPLDVVSLLLAGLGPMLARQLVSALPGWCSRM